MQTTASDAGHPRLTTIPEAIAMLAVSGVTTEMVRAWIRRGRLAAVRAGKAYLIDPADLASLLRPTLRQRAPRPARESETARIGRQLAEAGIG